MIYEGGEAMRRNGLAPLPEWETDLEQFYREQAEKQAKRELEKARQRVVPCRNTKCDDLAVLLRAVHKQIKWATTRLGEPVMEKRVDHHIFDCPSCGWTTKRKGNGNARNS
tara:strand:+ start:60 stop:392 length:333 start_codon:yes stop_codon:yes gene_type:complete